MNIQQIIGEEAEMPRLRNTKSLLVDSVLRCGKTTALAVRNIAFALPLLLLTALGNHAFAQYTFTLINGTPTAMSGNEVVGTGNSSVNNFLYNTTTGTYTALALPTAPSGVSGNYVVGSISSGPFQGFLYNITTGTYITLNDPNAVSQYGGTMVNGIYGNTVAGGYEDANGTGHGFLYNISTGVYTTLDARTSAGKYDDDGWLYGIYGNYVIGEDGSCYLYDMTTGTYTAINDPNGSTNSLAGISNDELLGTYNANNTTQDFLYNIPSGQYSDVALDPPGIGSIPAWVTGISNSDELFGYYYNADDKSYGFIASPVPEPSTWALLGLCIPALLVFRRKAGGSRAIGA